MLRVFVDAATKGNPGPSGGGILILGEGIHEQHHVYLGEYSNHEAEFLVFLQALTLLEEQQRQNETILMHSDSKIVVTAFEKQFAKNPLFQPYVEQLKQKLPYFQLLLIKWLPERQNKGADALARQALQKHLTAKL